MYCGNLARGQQQQWHTEGQQHARRTLARSLPAAGWQLVVAIAWLALLLGGVIAFLLVATVAFHTNGGFAAVVQSALVSLSGASSRALVKRPKGEELQAMAPDELKALVKASIQGDEDGD